MNRWQVTRTQEYFFQEIRQQKDRLKMTDEKIAELFRVPVGTVALWLAGQAAPTLALRRLIVMRLAEMQE